MMTSVEGIYRNGKVELIESPVSLIEDAKVIVTFLESAKPNSQARAISETQAADLRARLRTFAEDWDSDEMSVYDDYDSAKSQL